MPDIPFSLARFPGATDGRKHDRGSCPKLPRGAAGVGKGTAIVDMRLEVVVMPVSDVGRATAFHQGLGRLLDVGFADAPDFRVVQVRDVNPGAGS